MLSHYPMGIFLWLSGKEKQQAKDVGVTEITSAKVQQGPQRQEAVHNNRPEKDVALSSQENVKSFVQRYLQEKNASASKAVGGVGR